MSERRAEPQEPTAVPRPSSIDDQAAVAAWNAAAKVVAISCGKTTQTPLPPFPFFFLSTASAKARMPRLQRMATHTPAARLAPERPRALGAGPR